MVLYSFSHGFLKVNTLIQYTYYLDTIITMYLQSKELECS